MEYITSIMKYFTFTDSTRPVFTHLDQYFWGTTVYVNEVGYPNGSYPNESNPNESHLNGSYSNESNPNESHLNGSYRMGTVRGYNDTEEGRKYIVQYSDQPEVDVVLEKYIFVKIGGE